MEALPGFAACAEAEAALGAALRDGGFTRAAYSVVAAAKEAREAWSALILASPTAAEAAGGLARCAAGCEGRAKAAAAAASDLPLEPRSSAALALRALLDHADVAYAGLDASLAPRCAALPGGAGGSGSALGDAGAAARLRADARLRRGDARRYAAEALEADGSAAWSAALGEAAALYRQALALWPACGRARNLLGVTALARGDEAGALSHFLQAQLAAAPFAAAGANAAPLLRAASSRPLRDADGAGDALAGLAETRLLRCVGLVLLDGRGDAERSLCLDDDDGTSGRDDAASQLLGRSFDAAARGAALSLEAALGAGSLPPAAALRCVLAVASAVSFADVASASSYDQSEGNEWPPPLRAALRLAAELAPPLLRAAAGPDGRYLAAASALLDWLRAHAPLLRRGPDAAAQRAQLGAALAQLLNAAPLRAHAAVGDSLGVLALRTALPEDWALRGLVPFSLATSARIFCGGGTDDKMPDFAVVSGTKARAVRAARVAAWGAWAVSHAAAADGAAALVRYDHAAAAYTDCDGAAPEPLLPPPPPPPSRFPQPPAAPLPPPASALRHSLSFAALSLGGASNIWAAPPTTASDDAEDAQRIDGAGDDEQPASLPLFAAPLVPPPRRSTRGAPASAEAPGSDPLHASACGLGPQLVVLDVPNIAMRAGRGARCSVAGVSAAVDFWRRRGHVVVGFLPAHMLDAADEGTENEDRALFPQSQPRRPAGAPASGLLPPDDPAALRALASESVLVATPAGSYDDAYAIAYARRHGGVLVSNDRYADAVATAPPGSRREALRVWLRARVCTFAFAGAEFLPNPAFSFSAQQEEATEADPPAEDQISAATGN